MCYLYNPLTLWVRAHQVCLSTVPAIRLSVKLEYYTEWYEVFQVYHAVSKSITVLCNKHCKSFLHAVLYMIIEYNYRIKSVLHARVVKKNRTLQNYGIDAHSAYPDWYRRSRPLTCLKHSASVI